jgi:uncharacterized membrane protein (DUF485 family)
MSLSLFVLALYVFLQSAPAFNWFTVDPKLTAFVGIVFVIAVIVEAVVTRGVWVPRLFNRRQA